MLPWAISLLLILLVVGAVIMLASTPFQDVTRQRVERFAIRQRLYITPRNGDMVIRYLATTRRWRGVGLLASLVVSFVLASRQHHGLQISATGLFVGWFIGALIAEWRVSVLSTTTPRRAAVLIPRSVSDYLTAPVRWATAAVLGVTLATCVIGQAFTDRHGWLAVYLALGLVSAAVVWLAARHILDRPQPAAEPAILAADESIRSRSLHVITGSTIAICSWILPSALELVLHGRDHITNADGIGLLSVVLLAVGAGIARRASMTPKRPLLDAPHHVAV